MPSYRPQKVANVIRKVVSEAIAKKLSDPRIEGMPSVTRVEVSGDLEHAKVYVSVMGTDSEQRMTMRGLGSAAGYIQRLVGSELHIRHCPHLSFHQDESLKRAAETIRLIEEVTADQPSDSTAEDSAGSVDRSCESPRGDET
jgi:ribosome-binding factor A